MSTQPDVYFLLYTSSVWLLHQPNGFRERCTGIRHGFCTGLYTVFCTGFYGVFSAYLAPDFPNRHRLARGREGSKSGSDFRFPGQIPGLFLGSERGLGEHPREGARGAPPGQRLQRSHSGLTGCTCCFNTAVCTTCLRGVTGIPGSVNS